MPKIAVVTDAIDEGFYFQAWLKYYGSQFGLPNMFVCTYGDAVGRFSAVPQENVRVLASGYNDQERAGRISAIVAELLQSYDFVVRVDADEFLVPDLRLYRDLADYVAECPLSYVSARGLDVVHRPGEPALKFDQPIMIQQRKFGYPNNALNKTCLTSRSLSWGGGFHWCDHPPVFHRLFLLHLKRADIEAQFAWGDVIRPIIVADEPVKTYYSPNRSDVEAYHAAVSSRPIVSGWDNLYRTKHLEEFLANVRESNGFVVTNFDHELVLVEFPRELSGVF